MSLHPAPLTARWSSVLWLSLGVMVLRIVYLAWWCPYTLVEDEAHYWEWSRRLEWSYYSKGPGVAWAIAACAWVFERLGLGVSELTVRLPSVVMSSVLMVGVAGLARQATGDKRAGFYAAALTLLAPVFEFGGMLMTIDVPYTACWALAAWCGWRALRGGSAWSWVGMGAAIGVGVLFKYTILLLVPGVIVWAIVERRRLRMAAGWKGMLALGVAVFALGLAPVVIWNAQHDWATVRHLMGHLGMAGGDVPVPSGGGEGYSPVWTLTLISSQLPLMGLTLPIMILAALRAHGLKKSDPEGSADRLYLLLCAAPIFVFYLIVSFVAEPEGNWPLAGYATLFCLGGWGTALSIDEWKVKMAAWRALPPPRPWRGMVMRRPETLGRMLWRLAVILGVVIAVGSARVDWLSQTLPMKWIEQLGRAIGAVKPDRPMIPLGRLMGAGVMAEDAARLAGEVSAEVGKEVFVVAQQYGRASLLAFYMPGRPTVYCSSSRSEGRRTQYDIWPQTSLDDPGLMGRPAVLVGGRLEHWLPAFESVREYGQLKGETKRDRLTFVGIGYRGFPNGGAR